MKYLYAKSQSVERFNLLLSLTKISSDDVINALYDHLVNGAGESNAATMNGVSQSNFQRAFNKLNKVAEAVENIKVIDLKSDKR
jgi:predicted DNA-binding protein (UPF0251 family)